MCVQASSFLPASWQPGHLILLPSSIACSINLLGSRSSTHFLCGNLSVSHLLTPGGKSLLHTRHAPQLQWGHHHRTGSSDTTSKSPHTLHSRSSSPSFNDVRATWVLKLFCWEVVSCRTKRSWLNSALHMGHLGGKEESKSFTTEFTHIPAHSLHM